MSGITAQQYLRKAEGIVVARTRGPSPQVEVIKNGQVKRTYKGDCLGTAALFVFSVIWNAYRHRTEMLYDYHSVPAFQFIHGFNIDDVLEGFKRLVFEEQILPHMRTSEQAYVDYANKYDEAARIGGIKGKYALYDVLVRMFTYMRTHNFSLDFIDWSSLHPVPISEAAKNLVNYDAYILPNRTDHWVGILEGMFPEGGLFDHNAEVIYVRDKRSDTLSVIGGVSIDVAVDSSWFDGVTSTEDVIIPSPIATNVRVAYDDDELKEAVEKIVELMGARYQKMTADQLEFIDGPKQRGLIGPQGVGANALRGLAAVIKNGPLEDCVKRGIEFVIGKNPRFTRGDALAVVISRVSLMTSAKRTSFKDGMYHLEDLVS